MATKKVGDLIKEARTNAGLTQEQLAKSVDNVTASDISKAERGEKALPQAALKQIAKATGVTQKSLLEAAAGTSTAAKKTTAAKETAAKTTAAKSTASKTSTAKTGAAKTTTAKASTAEKTTAAKKTTTAKKTTAAKKTTTASKTSSNSGASVKLTAAEKRIIELYRKADADTKKEVEALLKGEKAEEGGIVESLLGGILSNLGK